MIRVVALLVLAAAAFAQPRTMRVAIGEGRHVLDPHLATGAEDVRLANALFEGLAYEDPETHKPVPGVAARWDVSEDGRVWTFHLRKGAKWSTGERVTARDFHWSWQRALSPATESEYAYLLWDIVGAEAFSQGKEPDFSKVGIEIVDGHTLRVELRAPVPYFAALLAFPVAAPVHRITVQQHRGVWTHPAHIVSNGPFVLAEHRTRAHVRLEKNPVYWNAKAIRLDRIDVLVKTPPGALFAFVNRQVDWNPGHWLSAALPHVKKHPGYRSGPAFITYFYRFNLKREHFTDVRVRRAFCHAIDRREVVPKDGQIPTGALVPPGIDGYESPAGRRHDPDRARALMAAAGYPGGKAFPAVDFLHNTSASHAALAKVVAAQLKGTLGVEMRIRDLPWEKYQEAMRTGRFDVARAGWIGDFADPITFLDMWITDGGNNQSGYASPLYDRLYKISQDMPAFVAEPDETLYTKIVEAKRLRGLVALYRWREARLLVLKEMERLVVERDCPIVPLYQYVTHDLVQPHVRGFHPNPRSVHPLRGFWITDK